MSTVDKHTKNVGPCPTIGLVLNYGNMFLLPGLYVLAPPRCGGSDPLHRGMSPALPAVEDMPRGKEGGGRGTTRRGGGALVTERGKRAVNRYLSAQTCPVFICGFAAGNCRGL